VRAGNVTQLNVHPSGLVHYATADSYKGDYSLLAAAPQTRQQALRLPFAEVKELAVVSPTSTWHRRFAGKYKDAPLEIVATRLRESIGNLDECLSIDGLSWVVNVGRNIEPIARAARGIILDQRHPDRAGRQMAVSLRKYIIGLLTVT
jgi:hypothetical protein